MRLLFIGDIVGKVGRRMLKENLKALRMQHKIDICVANAENAAAGVGLTQTIARDLFSFGVDCITMGNHTFARQDIFRFIDDEPRLVRPANVCAAWPGADHALIDAGDAGRLLVINLLGRVGMDPANSPYNAACEMADRYKDLYKTKLCVLDFHAEATSEKVAMAYHVDGKISVVVGTHTHVQTADEKILPRGTGHISDVGMTGAYYSVLGMAIDASLRRLADQLPAPFVSAEGRGMINGIMANLNIENGRCISIERLLVLEKENSNGE